jgi:hypothetical protein
MSDNDDFNRGNGNPDIGRELTRFYIGLLQDGEALRRYYDRDTREEFIANQGLSEEAARLVLGGSLNDIEEHILAVPGSYAKPLVIVWPAM